MLRFSSVLLQPVQVLTGNQLHPSAPAPLSRAERIAASLIALLVAITRWPALSLTLWDWDEALFALALRDYDVTAHHPHPPGFPLFIAAARLLPLDGFHALQTIVFVSALFVFPAAFFLARELRARHQAVAVGGAAEVDRARALDEGLVEIEEGAGGHVMSSRG